MPCLLEIMCPLKCMTLPGRCELSSCSRQTVVMGRKQLDFFIRLGGMLLIFLTSWHTLVSDITRK